MILAFVARGEAEQILIAHQRRDAGSCLCGWGELGRSHAGHQVEMLAARGLLRDRPAEGSGQGRSRDDDLVPRVRDVIGHAGLKAAGHQGPTPSHGEASGVKWRVDSDDPERPGWEGGYVCHCGEVFARSAGQGGPRQALVDLLAHIEGAGKR